MAIGSRTTTVNVKGAASQTILDLVYAYYNAHAEDARFFASNNLAVPADLFRACGKFYAQFRVSEDREFCNRWHSHGLRMVFEPRAIVTHYHALTLRSYSRQHFEYAQGAAWFHRICAARDSGRLRDHFGFYAQMPRLWWAVKPDGQHYHYLRMLPRLVLWQAANAAGYLWEAPLNRALKNGILWGNRRERAKFSEMDVTGKIQIMKHTTKAGTRSAGKPT